MLIALLTFAMWTTIVGWIVGLRLWETSESHGDGARRPDQREAAKGSG